MNQSIPAVSASVAASDSVPSQTNDGIRWRWWGTLGGILTGLFDALTMKALGVSFQYNGLDVRLPVGAYFGITFAVLGFLLGYTIEARRRDRRTPRCCRRRWKR